MQAFETRQRFSRREFLAASAAAITATTLNLAANEAEPIIDIHQHTNYSGRSDQQLLAHQRAMGITKTILLPAGRPVNRPSTHNGNSNGLAARAGGNETVFRMVEKFPNEFLFGANEVADLPEAINEIEKYLKLGAVVIGESKFGVDCDSPQIERIYKLAEDYKVPVLLHFQHGMYNHGLDRFYKVLEKFPNVNFIGHAQTWWANIDKDHKDQKILYPKGRVTPGGWTDRYLRDYPNMFGDLSAGSGLNSLLRDEDHAREFIERHQDKLLYGSDCNDTIGRGPGCQGGHTLAAVRRLASGKRVERKLLYDNSKKLFRL